jgi:hypothetical protein
MAATATEIANLAIAHLGGRALAAPLSTDSTQQAVSLRKWWNPEAGTPVYTALDETLRMHPWNFATARKRQTVTYHTLTGSAVTNEGGLIKITHPGHGYTTGDRVYVKDVEGVTAANGQWYVTVDGNHFTLDDSVFAGTYTSATGSVVGIPQFAYDFQHTPPADCLRPLSINADGGQNEDDGSDFLLEKGLILCDDETINLKYIQRITDITEYPADFVTAFSYLLASYIASDTAGSSGRATELHQFFTKAAAPPVKSRDANEGKGRRITPFDDSQVVLSRGGYSL